MEEKPKGSFIKKVKQTIYVLGGIVLFFVIIGSIGGKKDKVAEKESAPVTAQEQPHRPKEEAQKELDEFMELSKKSQLVTSYEFSDHAAVVYVTDVWYSLPVDFKKDFLAHVAMLKDEITGFRHFEVRHYQSNEKVGEVTAFGSSLEVYK